VQRFMLLQFMHSWVVVPMCFLLLLGMQVSDWLDFVVGRVDAPPGQMRRDKPLDRRRSKKKRGAGATTEEEGEGQDLYNSGGGRVSTTGLRTHGWRPLGISSAVSLSAQTFSLVVPLPFTTDACLPAPAKCWVTDCMVACAYVRALCV
jgi:hypothetical protein